MANESIGYQAVIGYGDGADPEVFTDFANIYEVGDTDMAREDIDVTNNDQTDKYRRFIGGLIDAGEVEARLTFEKSEYTTILALLDDDNQNFQITIPDGSGEIGNSTFVFDGYMNALGTSMPMEDKMSIRVKFKMSGAPTFTEGT